MSPRTSVRFGFSRVTDDGKIVLIWNFGDLEDALNCIDSPQSDLSIENVDNPNAGLGSATAAHLQDIILRNLADEVGSEGNSLAVQTDQARTAMILPLESLDRTFRYTLRRLNLTRGYHSGRVIHWARIWKTRWLM